MFKAVLFDLDGTLFDSSPGIFHTANFTVKELGFEPCEDLVRMKKFVGPPLKDCFRIVYNTPEEYLDECVRVYREEYKRKGMKMVTLYEGIKDTLIALRRMGIKTGVCTNKYEELAVDIFRQQGILELFDIVKGTDEKGTITKSDCIRLAYTELNLTKDDVLMVGDTHNDEEGAANNGVAFCGVLYGFGFSKKEDISYGCCVNKAIEILDIVKKENNMDIRKIDTKAAPAAIGPYSQAVAFGNFVFCSGQIPINPETGAIEGSDAASQARQCFKNIKAVLKEAGTSLEKVVKATVFLKDMNDFASVNSVYAEAFENSEILPARSAVQVAKLPKDVMVEIEVIALI